MITTSTNYFEIEYKLLHKQGQQICGDVVFHKRIPEENRTIIVLSDGLGSGVKANIMATMTASMLINFAKANTSMLHTVKTIMRSLPVDSVRQISYATFTLLDIEDNGKIKLFEFGNPAAIVLRSGVALKFKKSIMMVEAKSFASPQKIYSSEFSLTRGDMVIFCSDGVSQSGMGSSSLPLGWNEPLMEDFLQKLWHNDPEISAKQVRDAVLKRAVINDNNILKDDASCCVVQIREPRKIMVVTGPPFDAKNDAVLGRQLANFEGDKVICGGTTAQIIAREWKRELKAEPLRHSSGMPAKSLMKGVDLVTEGILTIGKLQTLLETTSTLETEEASPAGELARLFSVNDSINFVVGTRINEAHQDPTLPVELEIRRNVVKRIADLLTQKFLKEVHISYI